MAGGLLSRPVKRAGGVSPPSETTPLRTGSAFLGGLTPPARWVGFAVVAAVALVIVAHGCHGADVDHEPGVVPPHRQRAAEPSAD